MSIGRALAEYISVRSMPAIGNPEDEDYIPADLILKTEKDDIYPDVVDFVDTEFRASAQDEDNKSEGLAYGIVSDILGSSLWWRS